MLLYTVETDAERRARAIIKRTAAIVIIAVLAAAAAAAMILRPGEIPASDAESFYRGLYEKIETRSHIDYAVFDYEDLMRQAQVPSCMRPLLPQNWRTDIRVWRS